MNEIMALLHCWDVPLTPEQWAILAAIQAIKNDCQLTFNLSDRELVDAIQKVDKWQSN
jgi:hypothetical protein